MFTTADDFDHYRALNAYLNAAKLHVAETIILHGTKSWSVPDRSDKSATSAKCIFGLIVVHVDQAGKLIDVTTENDRTAPNYFKVKLQAMTKIFTVSFFYYFLFSNLFLTLHINTPVRPTLPLAGS